MALLLTTLLLASSLALVSSQQDCPPCNLELCPSLTCPAGKVVIGKCACCPICALDEGESCFNASIKALRRPKNGEIVVPCGENLDCILRRDLAPSDKPEALCVCKQKEPVCGSNGHTYDNMCILRKEAIKYYQQGALFMKTWGPCKSEPTIVSSPEDTVGGLHQGLALDCEAKGFPIPDIHWEFTEDNGEVRNLPSDDLFVAIQVRGGPEPYMVTSWVQIVDLRHKDTGIYTCVAKNSQGEARSSAKVGVYREGRQRRTTVRQ